MTLQFKVFESGSKSWDQLAREVAEFASKIGPAHLTCISQSADGGAQFSSLGSTGCFVVWYWV